MKNSGAALILSLMVLSNLAYATLADCPACSGKGSDWSASATNFLEGKPTNDVPSNLNSAQQARLIDTQIDSKKKSDRTSNVGNNPKITPMRNSTSTLNIVLSNISAKPNPANLNDPVMITAVFGNNSSETNPNNVSRTINSTGMMVYADIKNAAGIQVSRVYLRQISGNEYAGIWYANLGAGDYNTTIDASGVQGSRIFDDALRIVVEQSKNPVGNTHVIRKLG